MKYAFLIFALCGLILACNPAEEQKEKRAGSNAANTAVEPEKPNESGVKVSREYHENGQLKMEGPMVNGKRHGVWTSWYENGLKWSETTFSHGIKSGRTITYYDNGMMRYNGEYDNDERVGVWNFYNQEGVLEKQVDHDKGETE